MGSELEAALNDTRDEIESTLGALRGALGQSLDWRVWVQRRPISSVVLAVVLGLRLGRGRWL